MASTCRSRLTTNSGQAIVSDTTSVAFYDYNTLRYYDGVVWYANSDLLSTGGWTDGLPFANWATGKMSAQGTYIDPNGQAEYCPNATGYVFRDMSGGSHALGLGAAGSTSTKTGTAECPTVALQGGDDLFAASITDQPTSVTTLFTPLTVNDLVTGTTYKFAGSTLFGGSSGTGLLPFLIEDRNGNQLNITQSVIPSQDAQRQPPYLQHHRHSETHRVVRHGICWKHRDCNGRRSQLYTHLANNYRKLHSSSNG